MIARGNPMMAMRASGVVFLACGLALAAVARGAATRTYTIDPARSRATIAVGKSGLLSFAAGHGHEVIAPTIAGSVTVDPAEPSRAFGASRADGSHS